MNRKFTLLSGLLIVVAAVWFVTNDHQVNNYVTEKKKYTKDIINDRINKKKNRMALSVQKFDNPNSYNYFHLGIRTREGERSPLYQPNYQLKELEKARRSLPKNRRTSALDFVEHGPANTPGRARSVLILPNDPSNNTWLVGSVGGGIWKTTDGGESWINTTKELPSLAITSMDFAKSNPDIIYAGTGEVIGGSVGIIGNGVYKSTDGGDTWQAVPSTTNERDFSFINRIIVHPDDPDIILLCTSQGTWEEDYRSSIYKSVNGGTSWTEVYQSNSWVSQLLFNPQNPNTVFAALWLNGTAKSTDGGDTWEVKNKGFTNVIGRVELAIAPTDSSWIYASVVGNAKNVNSDLYLSTDAGESWKLVDQKFNRIRFDMLGGQGDYDNTIAVNPYNKKEVYFGGVNLWKTVIGEGESQEFVKTVNVEIDEGDSPVWDFINFGAEYYEGKLELGGNIGIDDFNTVFLVTGPGISQKAHRFTVNKQGAGVPDTDYKYRGYVEVPFQVWDIDNNVQLMVSFRDQQEDSIFTLLPENTAGGADIQSREYVFIHDVDYAESQNASIAQNGGNNKGHTYRQMYFFWPVLREGKLFDSENMEEDTVRFYYQKDTLTLQAGTAFNVSDAYNNYGGKNPAYDADALTFVLHPDHHALFMLPIDESEESFRIYNCNDGGLYYSNVSPDPGINDGDWTFSGFGMNSSQFYSADKQTGADRFIGGMQDNGTWMSPDTVNAEQSTLYSLALTGDGFEAIWNNLDDNLIIGSSQFNGFGKTTDGGETWFNATSGIEGTSPFISKIANSPSNPHTLFTVTSLGVYKSEDFGDLWELTPVNDNWGFSSFLDVEVSKSNHNIIWAGSGMSSTQSVHYSTDGGNSFSASVNYAQATLGNLSGLATHPFEDSTAYVLFSFAGGPKILRTEDMGQTWEDISGFGGGITSANGFPDVAVYTLLVRPDNPAILWAGTEIGIFESVDNGNSWSFYESDLGAAAVWQMKVVDDKVVIATHGRGIWTAQLEEFIEVVFVPEILEGGTAIDNDLFLRINLHSKYDSTLILTEDGLQVGRIGPNEIARDSVLNVPDPDLAYDNTYSLMLASFRNGKVFESKSTDVLYFRVEDIISEYTNDFDDENEDEFIGNGFSMVQPSGFNSVAVHSLHPYPQGSGNPGNQLDFYYYLKHPVKINKGLSKIKFRDIAIVEPGENGVSFGNEGFYDYVEVEGSKDGIEWMSISGGYDARNNSPWLTAYNSGSSGTPSMYKDQEFNILTKFQADDIILIRFHLFSDPLSTGWGWAIDDLKIQDEILTALEPGNGDLAVKFYPNPVQESGTLSIASAESQDVAINLYNFQGSLVKSYHHYSLKRGENEIEFFRNGLKSGIYFVKVNSSEGEWVQKIILK